MIAYADTGFVVTLYKEALSFDERQRRAAKSEGLRILPGETARKKG